MIHEGLKNVAAGANPMVMKEELKRQPQPPSKTIKSNAQPVKGTADIARVGTVSSGDEVIGNLIAEAMEKVSQNGVITVESPDSRNIQRGCRRHAVRQRLYHSYGNRFEKMGSVLEDPYILITDKKISNIQEILPILEQVVQAGKKLLIIAEDVEGEALATIILNKLRGTFTCVCVKAPGFGDRRKEMLVDIATLTGGQVVSSDLGMELKEVGIEVLGRARQVKVTKEDTIIVDGAGSQEEIKGRIKQIKPD